MLRRVEGRSKEVGNAGDEARVPGVCQSEPTRAPDVPLIPHKDQFLAVLGHELRNPWPQSSRPWLCFAEDQTMIRPSGRPLSSLNGKEST